MALWYAASLVREVWREPATPLLILTITLPVASFTALAIGMAWQGFLRGRAGGLLFGHALLVLFSSLLASSALHDLFPPGTPGPYDDPAPDPEAARAFAWAACQHLLALWMALTAGTALALRVRAERPPEPGRDRRFTVLVYRPDRWGRGPC